MPTAAVRPAEPATRWRALKPERRRAKAATFRDPIGRGGRTQCAQVSAIL